MSFDAPRSLSRKPKTEQELKHEDFYKRKMQYLNERFQVLDAERARQEKEEAKMFGKVPLVSERTKLLAENYRLKQNLIRDEQFIKRVFDREANGFKKIANPDYRYNKQPIKKKNPKHWTFEEAEMVDLSKSPKRKNSPTTQRKKFDKSYKFNDDGLTRETVDDPKKKTQSKGSKEKIEKEEHDYILLARDTPPNRTAKRNFDFRVAEQSARQPTPSTSRLRTREISQSKMQNLMAEREKLESQRERSNR